MNRTNDELVDEVASSAEDYIVPMKRSGAVLEAMRAVDRSLFVPFADERVYADIPVPIGYGQTCSQPSMVAFMLDLLELRPGMKVLEVGAGCGYAAAAASLLVGREGAVYACEILGPLYELLCRNVSLRENIIPLHADGSSGIREYAPYDRIFLSAGAGGFRFDEAPFAGDLSDGGILQYPEVCGNLYRLRRDGETFTRELFCGVRFVPLVRGRQGG